jgi:hypothetical protein
MGGLECLGWLFIVGMGFIGFLLLVGLGYWLLSISLMLIINCIILLRVALIGVFQLLANIIISGNPIQMLILIIDIFLVLHDDIFSLFPFFQSYKFIDIGNFLFLFFDIR